MARLKRDEAELPATGRTISISTGVVVTMNKAGDGDSVGAPAITTSTVGKWLKVRDEGTDYYIPMWS